jgi:hypothetical protein
MNRQPPMPPRILPGKGSGKLVLYIDQCVVSELVRCQLSPDETRSVHRRFLSALDEAVLIRKRAICVESIYHRIESGSIRPGRLTPENLWEFLYRRSRGLSLESCEDIFRSHVLQLIADRGGYGLPDRYLWKLGFNHDPNTKDDRTVLDGRFLIGVPWGREDPCPDYSDSLEHERRAGLLGSFEEELRRCQDAQRRSAIEEQRYGSWASSWAPPGYQRPTRAEILAVLESPELFDLPFPRCSTLLRASLLSEKHRRFRASDAVDIRFASRALPYCDLMVVDSNLADRIKRLKLDKEMGTRVESAGTKGIEAATNWINENLLRIDADNSQSPNRRIARHAPRDL